MTNLSETNKRLHKLLYGKNPIDIRAFENIGKYFQSEFSCGFSVTINGLNYYIKSVCIFDSKTCVYSNCSYLMTIEGKKHNIKISSAQELKEYIDNNSVFEEDFIYDVGIGIQTKSNRQLLVEKKQREYKEGTKKKQRESQFHKDYVEKQKQLRKQKYKEYKEKMKNK